MLAWNDTREVRPEKARAVAILNDSIKEPNYSAIEALGKYNINAIPWSMRDAFVNELVA